MPSDELNPFLPVIPETITVHLGPPTAFAQNVTVSFSDYIKNVASSEIYPTWPEDAIRANIYAQMSFALNRIYTEYYRSRGYNFDITSDTAYDQAFVNNRDIFENVSYIVEELLGSYIRRTGSIEPLFAQYCNGTTTTCPGLSQWGTVALAQEGLSPFEILQYYFGDNIEIVENAPTAGVLPSLPPYPLQLGSASNDVALIQARLNRVSTNYPNIPKIPNVNGIFGVDTRDAVLEFQRTFDLVQDGIVGRSTWYEILRVYNAVKRLNELNSEQITFDEIPVVFPVDLRRGSAGNTVKVIQYYLNYASVYDNTIPQIAIDGYFGEQTEAAVQAFQAANELPITGIMDEPTFVKLFDTYISIINSFPDDMFVNVSEPYPGTALLLGSESESVRLLQKYLNALSDIYPEIGTVNEDGIFGEQTEASVKAFQQIFGLPENGVVGPVVWNTIAEQYDNIAAGEHRNPEQWSS